MLNQLSSFIVRRYSPLLMLALLVATSGFFWLFNFSNFSIPISNPQLVNISGGEGLLDLKFFYSAQEAYAILTQCGIEGRALYKRFLPADFIFLICYGFGFSLLFTRLSLTLHGPDSGWTKLNLLPLGIALADFAENILILLMLVMYPEKLPIVGTLAGYATLTKQFFTLVSLIILFVIIFQLLVRRLKSG